MHTHAMYRSERIREIREARALTQTQLAKALAVSLAEVFDDTEEAPLEQPDPLRESGDLGLDLSAFEVAALSAVDPTRHAIVDLSAAAEAWRLATRASNRAPDPAQVARLWLDAARALRLEGAAVTPTAVIARVAMGEIDRNTA